MATKPKLRKLVFSMTNERRVYELECIKFVEDLAEDADKDFDAALESNYSRLYKAQRIVKTKVRN